MQPTCSHFDSDQCRSCAWLNKPYSQQLVLKTQHLKSLLQDFDQSQLQWIDPFVSPLQHFRNKAKMVVSGSVERPILGILSAPQKKGAKTKQKPGLQGIDLCDCPLYPATIAALFPVLKDFIARAGLVPYNVAKQKGELKYILITESQISGEMMVRFVLRSENKLPLIQRELAGLLKKLPQIKVLSLNIQPNHAAILEGEKEIFLTKEQYLAEDFNQIPLFIRPQGFFQTNPKAAQALYKTAQQWTQDLPIHSLWDLFCGVGGFGLHCTKALQAKDPNVTLTGIEISASAIECAKNSAKQLGLNKVHFQSLDAATFALDQNNKPDLVIVNPPRRGIGKNLANFLNEMQPNFLLYSSCNAETMAKDFALLSHYKMQKIQLFDMFPHTAHYEVLVLLCSK